MCRGRDRYQCAMAEGDDKNDHGERFGLEEAVEPKADPSEPWEPPIPQSPLGPEGVPKEEDPGPDA